MTHFASPKPHQKFLYWMGRTSYLLLFKLLWRLEVRGQENIPKQGGVLFAANHMSYADPPLVAVGSNRTLYFFAKEELFRIPIFGWLIKQTNAFPVKRYEHDIGAFKRAQQLLENGQVVLLFPEGRRSKTGVMGKAKPGVGMLAYKTNVPVVPVYISNSNQLKQFKKVKVTFGPPIYPAPLENEKEQYQFFSDAVMDSIANLMSKMYNHKIHDLKK